VINIQCLSTKDSFTFSLTLLNQFFVSCNNLPLSFFSLSAVGQTTVQQPLVHLQHIFCTSQKLGCRD
jgi:hypothetical protein